MKKLNKLMAVLLSLTLCLGMVAPAFAATLDDLQNAINGGSGDTEENKIDDGYYGYGANDKGADDESKGWDIWAKTDGDTRDVQLKGDVGPAPEPAEEPVPESKPDTVTVDKTVNLDLNDHNITGNGEDTVIEVEKGGDLTIENGTISNNPSNAETPAEGANGIDVEGDLTLDGVTIKDTDTAVNVEAGGTAEIEDSTITDNNTGVAFVDDGSVTFVEDQNVVNGNTTNISGTGKVKFELGGTPYEVDAKTAESLLKPDSIDSHGTDWILAKNGDGAYTVVYTGNGNNGALSNTMVQDILTATGKNPAKITEFVVSDGVTNIARAFTGCKYLKKVQLQGKVTEIGAGAFQFCGSLEYVNIPETVTKIGHDAFNGCVNLAIELKLPKGLTEIGYVAFNNCGKMTGKIEVPAGVTAIGNSAFNGCKGLTSLSFPKGSVCTSIGSNAFCGCSGLTGSVVIPEGVTKIEGATFKQTGLQRVRFNGKITEIGTDAFQFCKSLEYVNLSDMNRVTKIGHDAFNGCINLDIDLKLPTSLTEIGYVAFKDCVKLKGDITIPAGVTKIGSGAFSGCTGLAGRLSFAENSACTVIESSAFSGCRNLRGDVLLPEGVTKIESSAFYCTGLDSVTLKGEVTEIGVTAFEGCTNLKSINIPESVTTIGAKAFWRCSSLASELKLPEGLTSLGESAFNGCSQLKGDIVIPAQITTIGNSTFSGCKSLTSLTFPEDSSCTSIGSSAFSYCQSLKGEVVIPAGVTEIKSMAFNCCSNLEKVTLKGNVTTIGTDAFNSCSSMKSINIPDTVTSIGYAAFFNCTGLAGITLPTSVNAIGDGAFRNVKGIWVYPEAEDAENFIVGKLQNGVNVFVVRDSVTLYRNDSIATFDGDGSKANPVMREDGTVLVDVPTNNLTIANSGRNTDVALPEGGATVIVRQDGSLIIPNLGEDVRVTITDQGNEVADWTITPAGDEDITISRDGSTTRVPAGSSITSPDGAITTASEGATIGKEGVITAKGEVTFEDDDVSVVISGGNVYVSPTGTVSVPNNGTVKIGDGSTAYPSGAVIKDGVIESRGNVAIGDGSAAINAVPTEEDAPITVDPVTGDITLPSSGCVDYTDANGVNITVVPSEDNDITIAPNGTITNVPAGSTVTVNGVRYDFSWGGSIIVNEDGTVSVRPNVVYFDDFTGTGTGTEIDDPAIPLAAGPVTRAQFIDYLWRHEGEPEGADCTFADVPADHEYVLALGWAQANGIAAADADDNFQPDELVTVAAVREFLGNFASVFGTNAVAVADLTTLTGADDEAVLNCDQVLAQFFGEEYILPEELDSLEPDIAA